MSPMVCAAKRQNDGRIRCLVPQNLGWSRSFDFLEEGWVISHKNKQTSNEKSGVNLLTGHRSIAIEIENPLIPENLVNDLCVFSHAHSYKIWGGRGVYLDVDLTS